MHHLRRSLPAFTIFFAAGSILFLLLVIWILYGKAEAAVMPSDTAEPPAVEAAAQPVIDSSPLPVYTVRLSGQELQLWSPEKPGSYTILESIDPRALRSADRDALEQGVALQSMEAVVRFLEDFSS